MRTILFLVMLVVAVVVIVKAVQPYSPPAVHLSPSQCAQLPAGTLGC